MKQKVISMSILAAVVALGTGPVWAQSTAQDKSVGGTQDKRIDRDQQTPAPPGAGTGAATGSETGKGAGPSSGAVTQDKSVGGTQSQRTDRESQVPLPQGSRSAGRSGAESDKGDKMSSSGRMAGEKRGSEDIKQAQEALKNKGHDPGPIDGILGPQTRQAIRAFQGSNNLKQSGNLDAETSKALGVEKGSAMGSPSERGKASTADKPSSARESGSTGPGGTGAGTTGPSSTGSGATPPSGTGPGAPGPSGTGPDPSGSSTGSSLEKKAPRGEDQGQKTGPSSPTGK
jgi:peptidoglycan hydrolase-like protein with peptidoglycan-binding domain